MRILGIESTCDETSAAVVEDGVLVRSNVVASQVDLHARYRGVVPEIASRAHIENILPVVRTALEEANLLASFPSHGTPGEGAKGELDFSGIDAVAVAYRPGLIGSLLIGVTAAKTLAWAMDKPLIGVDHVHAHLYSVCLDNTPEIPMPAAGLVCSGGHTALYRLGSFLDVELIGSTIDDAVGEAYDKVAAILGLGYPGGPVIDRLAEQGNPAFVHFPRSRLNRSSLDFSFSGLKTSVLYHVRGFQGRQRAAGSLAEREIIDVAASFQAACVDVLVEKIRRAVKQTRAKSVVIGGGVSANSGLRKAMKDFGIPVFFPAMRYCTDNAAMTAGLGYLLLSSGKRSDLDLDAIPHSQFVAAKS